MTRRLARLGLLVFMVGCVRVSETVLVPGLPPISENGVRVFLPGDAPPVDAERVALFEAGANSAFDGSADIINKLRQKAAKLGANGLVVVSFGSEDPRSAAFRSAMTGIYSAPGLGAYAVAIRYRP